MINSIFSNQPEQGYIHTNEINTLKVIHSIKYLVLHVSTSDCDDTYY